jgi:hypothetical protein
MQWKVLGPEPGCRDNHDQVRSIAVVHGFGKIRPQGQHLLRHRRDRNEAMYHHFFKKVSVFMVGVCLRATQKLFEG